MYIYIVYTFINKDDALKNIMFQNMSCFYVQILFRDL